MQGPSVFSSSVLHCHLMRDEFIKVFGYFYIGCIWDEKKIKKLIWISCLYFNWNRLFYFVSFHFHTHFILLNQKYPKHWISSGRGKVFRCTAGFTVLCSMTSRNLPSWVLWSYDFLIIFYFFGKHILADSWCKIRVWFTLLNFFFISINLFIKLKNIYI